MDLIADIGATNSRCALLDDKGRAARAESFGNAAFANLESLLGHFLGETRPARSAIAIAGPILGDEVKLLNIDWSFSQRAMQQALGTSELIVMNDFEALAHALPRLRPEDTHAIGGGRADPKAARAVIGPGSGLGVATAAPHGDGWTAIGGEGGHVTLPTLSEAERQLIGEYCHPNGHCSAERLLSGPGLVLIYSSLVRQAGQTVQELTPAEITELAAQGDDFANRTYEMFFAMLGTVAGNLALTVGARGGVYIAGGIVPRIIPALEQSAFRERFIGKGRYRGYLDEIPTAVITVETPAFIGLKAILGYLD